MGERCAPGPVHLRGKAVETVRMAAMFKRENQFSRHVVILQRRAGRRVGRTPRQTAGALQIKGANAADLMIKRIAT